MTSLNGSGRSSLPSILDNPPLSHNVTFCSSTAIITPFSPASDFNIYDVPITSIKGKWTKRKPVDERITADHGLKVQRKDQNFVSDVMYVDGGEFLISVSSPLELTISSRIVGLTAEDVGVALQAQISG